MDAIRRRIVLAMAGGFASVILPASAQQPKKTPVVGWMMAGTSDRPELFLDVIRAFRAAGYSEREVNVVAHFAEGRRERLAVIAAELVDMKVDVLYAGGLAGTQAAKRVTSTTPIVFSGVGDPVGAGFVESLARPGRNITGICDFPLETGERPLELLLSVLPKARTIGVLGSSNPGMDGVLDAQRKAARTRGVALVIERPATSAAIEAAFAALRKAGAEGLVVISDGPTIVERARVAELATAARLPTISSHPRHAEDGVLMTYAPHLPGEIPQVVGYIDRILKGARPGELPVQGPREFELVLNRDAARVLGVTFPREALLRAHRIIGKE